jgi:hypothetical protein
VLLIVCIVIAIRTKKAVTQGPTQGPTSTPTEMPTQRPTVSSTTDAPTTDEPTTDEPTTDEPTTDEPTTDAPYDEQTTLPKVMRDADPEDEQELSLAQALAPVFAPPFAPTFAPKLRRVDRPDTFTLAPGFIFTEDFPVLVAISPNTNSSKNASSQKRLMLISGPNGFEAAIGVSRAASWDATRDEVWALMAAGAGAIFVRSGHSDGLYLAGDDRCDEVVISSSPYAWDASFEDDMVVLTTRKCSSKHLSMDQNQPVLRPGRFGWRVQKVFQKKSSLVV